MTENSTNDLNAKDLRFYAQQFSAFQQGGTPIGIKDRSLSRRLTGQGPVRKSKASSRSIRRAVERERRKSDKPQQKRGFS
jgi:hypothetical protein